MAPFDRIQNSDGRTLVDWRLMQNGAVTLFRERAEFDFAASWLKKHDYDVHASATTVSHPIEHKSRSVESRWFPPRWKSLSVVGLFVELNQYLRFGDDK